MIGPRRRQYAGKIARGKARDALPGDRLATRFGHVVLIMVVVMVSVVAAVAMLVRRKGVVIRVAVERSRESLEQDILGDGYIDRVDVGIDGEDGGWVVEDKGWAVARAIDDEGDGDEVVGIYKGHDDHMAQLPPGITLSLARVRGWLPPEQVAD